MSLSGNFIQAIKSGDAVETDNLLNTNPELVQARDENGISAVLLAAYYRNDTILGLILHKKPMLDIFEASATGDTGRVKALLDKDPGLISAFSADGFSALGLACFFGKAEAARLLVERGADVNQPSRNSMKVAPLHSAVASNQLSIVELLLAAGADVNARQMQDVTPLHSAAHNGNLDMIKLLLDYDPDISIQTSAAQTAAELARKKGFLHIEQLLLSHAPH